MLTWLHTALRIWFTIDREILIVALHYNEVIIGAMESQFTSITIVYSTVYSGAYQRKHQSVTGLCVGNSPVTGEFPAQMASNAENVSIWWRHYVLYETCLIGLLIYLRLPKFESQINEPPDGMSVQWCSIYILEHNI